MKWIADFLDRWKLAFLFYHDSVSARQVKRGHQRPFALPRWYAEWPLVSRADTFKRWGVTAEQMIEMRTAISEMNFVNPPGKHGGKGSTKAHNELLQIIDSSENYDMFRRRLQNWADYRFEGGSDLLPDGLKPDRR